MLSSAPTYTRTHMLSHSLSLRLFALSPLLSVSYKNPFPQLFDIIEIQDFAVFGCSHFIGSTNTKHTCKYKTRTGIEGSSGNTVVAHLPHHTKVEGLSPATTADTKERKWQ
jgi:hypothetical protein